jgi:hypothetical protein
MALSYSLIPILLVGGSAHPVSEYNAYKDWHRLRGYRLEVANNDMLAPFTTALSKRYRLKVTRQQIWFDISYEGVQKAGLQDPKKYEDGRVLTRMRDLFAEHALPKLVEKGLRPTSRLMVLAKFQDLKGDGVNALKDLVSGALGLED